MENTNIIQLLSDLVMIPSISSLDENQKDVLDSANYIADLFNEIGLNSKVTSCLLYTSPSPRDRETSRMPSSA